MGGQTTSFSHLKVRPISYHPGVVLYSSHCRPLCRTTPTIHGGRTRACDAMSCTVWSSLFVSTTSDVRRYSCVELQSSTNCKRIHRRPKPAQRSPGTLASYAPSSTEAEFLQALPKWREYFNSPSGAILGFCTASIFFPAIVSAFVGDWIAGKYGRKWSLALGAILIVSHTPSSSENKTITDWHAGHRCFCECVCEEL